MKSGTQITLFEELYEAQVKRDDEIRALRHAGFALNYVYGAISLHIDRNTYQDKDLLNCERWVDHCGRALGAIAREAFGLRDSLGIGVLCVLGRPLELPELTGLLGVMESVKERLNESGINNSRTASFRVDIEESIREIKKQL